MRMSSAEYAALLARRAGGIGAIKVADTSEGVEVESKLHQDVLAYCRTHGWICFHASMVHRTYSTIGTPDCIIIANDGRWFLIELKTRTGKLSTEQAALAFWAARLGTTIHVCRSMEDFVKVVTAPLPKP